MPSHSTLREATWWRPANTFHDFSPRNLYHTYWSPINILSLKKSLLVISKMLWLFANTFTADDKYFPLSRDNFTQPIQIQLSQRWKTFSELSSRLLKFGLNLNIFKKKLTLIANVLLKLQNRKKAYRWGSTKCRFPVPLEKYHGKCAQTHFTSSWWHLYDTYWSPITIFSL